MQMMQYYIGDHSFKHDNPHNPHLYDDLLQLFEHNPQSTDDLIQLLLEHNSQFITLIRT